MRSAKFKTPAVREQTRAYTIMQIMDRTALVPAPKHRPQIVPSQMSSLTEEQADLSHTESGTAAALERVCSLESRLRQAIQNSGSLRSIFGGREGKDDRELRALQNVQ